MKQKINQKNTAMNAESNQSLEAQNGYKMRGNSGLEPGIRDVKCKR